MTISERRENILLILMYGEKTFEEIMESDLMFHISHTGIHQVLSLMENKGEIYFKGDKYYVYSKVLKKKFPSEYKELIVSKRK